MGSFSGGRGGGGLSHLNVVKGLGLWGASEFSRWGFGFKKRPPQRLFA